MKYFIIALVILTSCGPQAKLRRAERLIAKAEAQGARWKSDTVFVEKQIITRERHIDTLIQRVDFRDTITVIQDKVVTKVKINTVTKEVFIDTECPPDTVKISVPVVVNREISAKKRSWTFYVAWALLLIIAAFVTGYLVRGQVRKDLTIKFDREKPEDVQ